MAEPYIKYSLGKFVDKGEDAWMQQPAVVAPLPGEAHVLMQHPLFRPLHNQDGPACVTFDSIGAQSGPRER